MILSERESRHQTAVNAALAMMTAARTAPKAKGVDIIEIAIIEGDDMLRLADEMESHGQKFNRPSFLRDAKNVRQSECVMIVGTKSHPMGLDCGYCGHPTCASKPLGEPCAFNSIDTGIAVGSACATAADLRVDTRVMYSAGLAAEHLGMLHDCRQIIAILVSVSSKSPYFDRPAL